MGGLLDSRYKSLLLSLAVFLALVAGILGFNYHANQQVNKISNFFDIFGYLSDEYYNVNLLTQRLQVATEEERPEAIATLRKSVDAVDEYMRLYETGGEYQVEDRTVPVEALTHPEDVQAFNELKAWWMDYKQRLNSVLDGQADVNPVARHIFDEFDENVYGPVLVVWDNQTARGLEWTALARSVMMAGFVLAGLYFIWFVFYFLKKLTASDRNLQIARRQTTNILDTVQEGLFLIDKNFVISDAHSKNLEVILGRKDIAGITLTELLQGMVGRDDIEATKLFVEQLYNPWVVSELIGDLNPLRQIKVNVMNEQGDTVFKYLSFSFLRVQESENDEVEEIFVSVVDVTDSVLLEKTLESEKAQHDRQIEMIGHILNVDINVLNQFINNTYERVSEMNEILRVEGQLHNKAQALFRKMHSLKGEASAIKMGSFVRLAEQGEENLVLIRNQSTVSGQDFLGFTIILNDILDLNQFVEKLLQRISRVAKEIDKDDVGQSVQSVMMQTDDKSATVAPSSHSLDWQSYFGDYAQQIAERQGKKVKVNLTGFEDIQMTDKLKKFCQDVGIQLLKNAIAHGIETPDVRVQAGKSEVGQIKLMLLKYGSQLRMSIIDDGAGVDLQKLRQKATEMNLMTAEQASSLPDSRLYAIMFRSGVSTANGVDEDSGRGVGMDIVREWVKEVNGKINVESQPGLNTKIVINFDAQ
ncbi:ATP-binding protein [Moraxella bovis]|uniref:ATP-binding protein n=1 Tax=Moraxella bovis TaxID=476 RepID=UPI002225D860|nr:ATP-binding protein [Moraxella bovis]UYZ67980.1 Hpt domain-containing protein [Moraxella bovis]UYZ70355.1 Hpt domain-containing protein [Moraxella bovis]UYZ73735.1 Hpt domain-containing protein [Moraxella bovis]UYZ94762.1 Hpt domain-containing protein [Moraxella bovis]UZA13654.1 Hpt domain-containing protein [Moraxella bovis]